MEEFEDDKRVIIPAPYSRPIEPPPLAESKAALAGHAAKDLWDAFDWSETPEGFPFWHGVVRRLEQIAKTRDHRV